MSANGAAARRRYPAGRSRAVTDAERAVREWIDTAQFERVERVPDQQAVFNFRLWFSDRPVHVVQNRTDGPLVVTAQVATDDFEAVRAELSGFERREVESRVHERLRDGPSLYYFLDEDGDRVDFADAARVRIERLVYPDGASQHELMTGIFEVGKRAIALERTVERTVERFRVATDD